MSAPGPSSATSSSNPAQPRGYQGVLELYSRLGNHRPFLQGEIRHFLRWLNQSLKHTLSPSILREFEGKRGDREVEKIFGVLERVSELRDCGLPQLVERASGGEAAKLVGALQVELLPEGAFKIGVQVSLSMVDRVQRQAETGEVEETLAASRLTWPSSLFVRDLPLREARAREWTNFQNEARARVARLEARDREQEEAIRRRWASNC